MQTGVGILIAFKYHPKKSNSVTPQVMQIQSVSQSQLDITLKTTKVDFTLTLSQRILCKMKSLLGLYLFKWKKVLRRVE